VSPPLPPTCPSDPTRSPWVTCLSSPPCRPHPPWYAGEEPYRLRLPSADSTIPQLGPTGASLGWLPSSTTRWFSADPSDSTSRWTPCPPKEARRGLQVHLGCLPLSRSCPGRLLHTCLLLWPVRRYPHFWISARGHELSGTSTRLRPTLPGTHYEGSAPAPSVAAGWPTPRREKRRGFPSSHGKCRHVVVGSACTPSSARCLARYRGQPGVPGVRLSYLHEVTRVPTRSAFR